MASPRSQCDRWPAPRGRGCARGAFLLCFLWATWAAGVGRAAERFTGLWDVAALSKMPAYLWGEERDGLRGLYYEGMPRLGRPTRVFAWLGLPPAGKAPVPGMLLLHGGGQVVNPDWVRYWVQRGYAALAMDLDARGPDGQRLPDGGPPLQTQPFFGPFPHDDPREGWIYHAVAAVMRAHTILAAQPGVDPGRIGLNGVSLGGSLACLVAGVDGRLRAVAPVYGAGFFNEGGYWMPRIREMDCRRKQQWDAWLDPGAFLPGVTCPVLFQNGATDKFTPPDTYQRNIDACGFPPTLAMQPTILHGNFWKWPWGEREVNLFLDHHLNGGPAPPDIRVLAETEDTVECAVRSELPVTAVKLGYTHDTGPWSLREWVEEELAVEPDHFTVTLPPERPLWALVTVSVPAPTVGNATFSTRYFHRNRADSPERIELASPQLTAEGLRIGGRKPFAQRILLERSADLCSWVKVATDTARDTAFSFTVERPTAPRFFRVRKWEVMQ